MKHGDLRDLADKWRRQAHRHLEAAQEHEDDAFGEEHLMHELEARTLNECADELERALVGLDPTVPF
jgi:arylsulfatase A-like enzyme